MTDTNTNNSSDNINDSVANNDVNSKDVKQENTISEDIKKQIEEATNKGYQKGINDGLHNKRRELARKAKLQRVKEEDVTDDYIVTALSGYEEYLLHKEKEAASEEGKKLIKEREEVFKQLEAERNKNKQFLMMDKIRAKLSDFNIKPEQYIMDEAISVINNVYGRNLSYNDNTGEVEVDSFSSVDKFLIEFKNRYHNLFSDAKAPVVKNNVNYGKPGNQQTTGQDKEYQKKKFEDFVYQAQR